MKKLYGIGTGPGSADLLTIRAVNKMQDSNIIFAPNNKGKNMALDTVKEYIENKKIVLIDFPMGEVKSEDYINAANTIYNEIPPGESGAFLTIGDPMIYSTFIYIMDLLKEKDIEIEIVSGIPSFVAAAGASKIPLTVKGDMFLLCDEYNENLIDKVDSVAILKTLKGKEKIIRGFEDNNFDYVYIKKLSLDDEEIIRDKEAVLKDKNYISLILGRHKGE